jgi:hypothetical protein
VTTAVVVADVGPRLATPRNPAYPTRGGAAAKLARKLGRPFLPWQRYVADVCLEYDPATGLWLHPDVVLLVPRQAGKTTLVGAVMHVVALLRPNARVWFTMQTGKDASDWFLFEHLPQLDPLEGLFRARRGGAQVSVQWHHNHSLVRVFPPQRDALHSKQSDLVVLDESWAHDVIRGDELLQAIGPTQATRSHQRPGAQVWTLSAAGDHTSGYLIKRLRSARAALAAGDHRPVLIEYGVPLDAELDALADRELVELVAAHHPAVGRLIDANYLDAELNRMGRDGFLRAYGCVQVMPDDDQVSSIDWKAWEACRHHYPIADTDRVAAFGVDVTADRSGSAIVAATDGGVVEVVEARAGTEWVSARLIELATRWRAPMIVDRYGATANVADDVVRAGHERRMIVPTSADVVAACQGFYDDVRVRGVQVRPDDALDAAVRAAATRPVGSGWVWDRRPGRAPVAPLQAASLAWWGAKRPDRTPRAY